MDETDLMVRLEMLDNMKGDFNAAQTSLEKLDLMELASDARALFDEAFVEVKSKLSRELVSLQRKNTDANSTTVRHSLGDTTSSGNVTIKTSRLPQLQLPKFNGSYMDWPNFYSIFSTVVENDAELTKVEKLQHLLSSLEGVALEAIRSLEPTEKNYDIAIKLLCDRFDNKLLLFQAHVKAIFGLKGVEKGSAIGLRALSDKMNSHLRAINSLADSSQILDGFLIHIVAQKLDQRTREKWEESLVSNELPAWTKMASFLEKRCRTMENVDNAMVTPTPSNQIILWRDSPADEIKAYKLDTLTYGTKSAAFLAIRTMHQLALDEEENFPIGSRIVRTHFYVDDLMSGGDSIEEVVEIKRQVKLCDELPLVDKEKEKDLGPFPSASQNPCHCRTNPTPLDQTSLSMPR
ncbi:hypothetical protein ACLKA6_003660 [Drosophila palustris]